MALISYSDLMAASIISKRATGSSSKSPALRRRRTGRMACPTRSRCTRGSRFKRRDKSTDHWHRTEKDPGRPYEFKDAETLIDDFFDEVERVLRDRGIGLRVTRTEASRRAK